MAQLTISQLIKMVLFGFVIVLVIMGASMGFNRYIIPYFKDIGPSSSDDTRNLGSQFYETLIQPENIIASLDLGYFVVDGRKTDYYVDDSAIYIDEFGWDDKAGDFIDYKISIDPEYLESINSGDTVQDYNALKKINGGEVVGNEVYKVTGA